MGTGRYAKLLLNVMYAGLLAVTLSAITSIIATIEYKEMRVTFHLEIVGLGVMLGLFVIPSATLFFFMNYLGHKRTITVIIFSLSTLPLITVCVIGMLSKSSDMNPSSLCLITYLITAYGTLIFMNYKSSRPLENSR